MRSSWLALIWTFTLAERQREIRPEHACAKRRFAVAVTGFVRTLEEVAPSLLRNVVEPNQAEVFYQLHVQPETALSDHLNRTLAGHSSTRHLSVTHAAVLHRADPKGQALTLAECFAAIARHTQRCPYEIVLRTRSDALLPPLDLSRLLLHVDTHVGGSVQPTIFVPLCCDKAGINDQLAVGTQRAMEHYAQWGRELSRTMNAEKATLWNVLRPCDECKPRDNLDAAILAEIPAPIIKVKRFWYEYALLRDDKPPLLHTLGAKTFMQYFNQPYMFACVEANADPTDVVDAGTPCTFDPEVETLDEAQRKFIYEQRKFEGWTSQTDAGHTHPSAIVRSWSLPMLKCRFEHRACDDRPSGRLNVSMRDIHHHTLAPYPDRISVLLQACAARGALATHSDVNQQKPTAILSTQALKNKQQQQVEAAEALLYSALFSRQRD